LQAVLPDCREYGLTRSSGEPFEIAQIDLELGRTAVKCRQNENEQLRKSKTAPPGGGAPFRYAAPGLARIALFSRQAAL
jgi:hypothetical protein